jgi:hypothetical protein
MTPDLLKWEGLYSESQATANALASELAKIEGQLSTLEALRAVDVRQLPAAEIGPHIEALRTAESIAPQLRSARRELARRADVASQQALGYHQELLQARGAAALARHKVKLSDTIDALKRELDAALSEPGARDVRNAQKLRDLVQPLLQASELVDKL